MSAKAEKLIDGIVGVDEAKSDVTVSYDSKVFVRHVTWTAGGKRGNRGDELMMGIEDGETSVTPEQEKSLNKLSDGLTIVVSSNGKVSIK